MTYQQITLVGNVGRNPELKYTANGVAVTDFSLAVNRTWTDQSGQKQERVTWWRVTCWRRQAEIVSQYVKQGKQVLVIGSQVEARAYQGKDGTMRASLEITADDVRFLSGGDGGGGGMRGGMDVAGGDYPDEHDFAPNDVDDIPF